jgi:hypothetical protein
MWSSMNPADHHPDSWGVLTLDSRPFSRSEMHGRRQLVGKMTTVGKRKKEGGECNITRLVHTYTPHTHIHALERLFLRTCSHSSAVPLPYLVAPRLCFPPACRVPFVSRLLSKRTIEKRSVLPARLGPRLPRQASGGRLAVRGGTGAGMGRGCCAMM